MQNNIKLYYLLVFDIRRNRDSQKQFMSSCQNVKMTVSQYVWYDDLNNILSTACQTFLNLLLIDDTYTSTVRYF